ncbi:Putative multidrug export ATP-binding/permease protein [Mycobacterium attenuatum]|uniref:ABC transporter ATP-binding protein n=1 Tax=Mycobacterium attenuatum TaxID=2341086 RepID=UPI000F1E72F4|nr:ABC transporter ATP-binding protein [Mycobacterium attenuatum]VBA58410.1 Putative multidrug export ATP-binding/permease protein [Mycobacterium attenuatum]
MGEARCTRGAATRSAPDIAAAPEHRRAATDLQRLLRYLVPYRTRWIVIVTAATASLVATVGIPIMTRAVIDGPVRHHDQRGLWVLGTAALGLGLSEAGLLFIRRWLTAHATMGVEADIRRDLHARLQILPMSFHQKWQSGQLVSRIMNDLATIRDLLSFGAVFMMLNLLQITVVTLCLLVMYWPLGVVVLGSIVPIVATVLHYQGEFTQLSRHVQDQTGHVATQVEESTLGRDAVLAFGREDQVYDQFDSEITTLYCVGRRKVSVAAKFWTLLEVIPNVALIVLLGFGAYAVGHGLVTIGTLAAFITMTLSLVWPVTAMGFLLSMTQEAMTAANRIAEIFDAPAEIEDGELPGSAPRGRLELRDVGFRVPGAGGDRWLLRHVTLSLEPGETLALVGCTGSGKSLLTALLSRIYDVSEGRIMLDGRDIREWSLPAVRGLVCPVFEDPTVFSMSVAENIRLGRPAADDATVAEAIELAGAQFVYDLPFGLDTRIGEQGMRLSAGQRQRLCIARALVAAPALLVVDDASPAADVLPRTLRGISTVVVARRVSTVQLADRVALLQDGTITHIGSHAELYAQLPRYRRLLDDIDCPASAFTSALVKQP